MNLSVRVFASAVLIGTLVLPHSALAARGDCGQPSTNGVKPLAADALTVLRASVGLDRCGICVCDADGSGRVLAGDALNVLRKSVGLEAKVDCSVCSGSAVGGVLISPFASLESPPPTNIGGGSSLPVPGALVELHEVNDAGVSTRLLNGELTDENGEYFFPTSTGLGNHTMLKAFNSSGTEILAALATEDETDIEPASQFVLSVVLGDLARRGINPGLANFTPREYNGCVAQARNVIPRTPPANIGDLLDLLLQAAGVQFTTQVRSFADSPDLNDNLAGSFWVFTKNTFLDASNTPANSEGEASRNSRTVTMASSKLQAAFDGAGNVTIGQVITQDFGLNETSGTISGGPNDGNKVNEDVTISVDAEVFDEPPALYDVADDGSILLSLSDGVILPMAANTDFSFLALGDIENDFDSFGRGLGLLVPISSGADESRFDGAYHVIEALSSVLKEDGDFGDILREIEFSLGAHTITADGEGELIFAPGVGANLYMSKFGKGPLEPPTDPAISIVLDPFPDESPFPFDYTVDANGRLQFFEDSSVIAEGAVSPDGSLAVLQSNSFDGERVDSNLLTLIHKGTDMDRSGLAGEYQLFGFEGGFNLDFTEGVFDGPPSINFREIYIDNLVGSATLNANGSFSISELGFNEAILSEASSVETSTENPGGRVFDAQVFVSAGSTSESVPAGTWVVAPDGGTVLSIDGIELQGAFSEDGSFFVVGGVSAEGSPTEEAGFSLVVGFLRN